MPKGCATASRSCTICQPSKPKCRVNGVRSSISSASRFAIRRTGTCGISGLPTQIGGFLPRIDVLARKRRENGQQHAVVVLADRGVQEIAELGSNVRAQSGMNHVE